MRNFTSIQSDFCEKKKQFEQLHAALSIRLVERDLTKISEQEKRRICSISNRVFELDDYVTLTICENGSVEIEDRRGTTFLWIFEILLRNEGAECGSYFKYGNNYYKVEELTEAHGEILLQKAEVVLQKAEKAVEMLQNNQNLDAWMYVYYDANEEKTCSSLEKVIETVLAHRPA